MNRCAGALAGALIIAYAPGALAAYGVDMNPTLPEAVAIYKRGDKKAAFKAMLYLARDNNAQAQGILGLMYSNGDGVTADQAEALRWLTRATERGDQEAFNWLGTMYAKGLGVPKDPVRAAQLYRRSADEGSAAGANNLAMALEEGNGVPKDLAEARRFYELAIRRGSSMAATYLAEMQTRQAGGAAGEAESPQQMARAGNLDGIYQLATAAPRPEALRLFEYAASLGHDRAEYDLAVLLMQSTDPVEQEAALGWMRKSAFRGHIGAQHDLASMLERRGKVAEAIQWYQAAAAGGHAPAKARLSSINKPSRKAGAKK